MDRDLVLEYLKSQKSNNIEKIGIFGSLAKNQQHFASDIDIIVKFKNDFISSCDPWEYFNILNKIKKETQEQFLVKADIVDEQSDSPYISKIKEEAIYV